MIIFEKSSTSSLSIYACSVLFLIRTNLPKELQEFPGFQYPKEWNSYISRKQCLQYLNEFTDHFDLRKYIKVGKRNIETIH